MKDSSFFEKAYLTVEEVAQRFEVDPSTVYRLAQRGELPGFKIGGQWRFSEEMLDDWVTEHLAMQRIKSTGFTTVSHELRTPLAVIQEGVSQLLDGMAGPLSEHQRRLLSVVRRNTQRLAEAVNGLLVSPSKENLPPKLPHVV